MFKPLTSRGHIWPIINNSILSLLPIANKVDFNFQIYLERVNSLLPVIDKILWIVNSNFILAKLTIW